jgi:beta-glucosidase
MYFSQITFPNVPDLHYIRVRTTFVAESTCKYRFGLGVCGKGRLFIDGKEAMDLWTDHPEKTDDSPCFNKLPMERFATLDIVKGQRYELLILMTNEKPGDNFGPPAAGGVRLGGQIVHDESKAIEDAVQLAKAVDVPILITGLSTDYDYEASDRTSLSLPGRENEMIQKVCDANPNTLAKDAGH